jgi:hypothetical protein
MAPPLDGSGVVTGAVTGGVADELFEPSFMPPLHALNKRAVAVLRANASEVFLGESILSPDFNLIRCLIDFLSSRVVCFLISFNK